MCCVLFISPQDQATQRSSFNTLPHSSPKISPIATDFKVRHPSKNQLGLDFLIQTLICGAIRTFLFFSYLFLEIWSSDLTLWEFSIFACVCVDPRQGSSLLQGLSFLICKIRKLKDITPRVFSNGILSTHWSNLILFRTPGLYYQPSTTSQSHSLGRNNGCDWFHSRERNGESY